jgi:MFS family permease
LSVSALTSDYLDKTTLSYASVFGLIEDANLDPNSDQYSWLGSIVYIAQLVMQPLVAYFLVRFPIGKFVGIMVLTWGAILCGMAGATDFKGLMATRFLLGAFEAAVGKCFQPVVVIECTRLTMFSAGLHRCSPDVVQALRADEP